MVPSMQTHDHLAAALSTKGLTHRYGDRLALDDVSLRVAAREIFGLLGPNGGGKTTLFRILSTLVRPTSGTASILGLDLRRDVTALRARIGVVFQAPSLDKKLRVRENLAHGYQRTREGVVSRSDPDKELDGRGYRVPNGALFSTINDLAKFVTWELGHSSTTLLKKETQDANYARSWPTAPTANTSYGVGFQEIRRGDVSMLGHGGSTAGYLSSALFHRGSGLGVNRVP